MTNEEFIKKTTLEQYKNIEILINSKLDEIKRFSDLSMKITSSFSQTPKKTDSEDKISYAIANILDLENEVKDDLQELKEIKRKIEKSIFSLQNKNEKVILYLKFIKFKTFQEIEDIYSTREKKYSERHIRRIYIKGLRNIVIL